MLFQAFLFPETNEVNAYIVGCEETRECVLIDAGADSLEYDVFLDANNARLTAVFLTHIHWDHTDGLDSILARHDVPVYSMTGQFHNGRRVEEGGSIPLGQLLNRLYRTTGHTPNSLTLVVEDRIAFVGDAIFAGAVGGTASDSQHEEEIGHVRANILTLPDDCLICSGHGPITTVGIEKRANPFF